MATGTPNEGVNTAADPMKTAIEGGLSESAKALAEGQNLARDKEMANSKHGRDKVNVGVEATAATLEAKFDAKLTPGMDQEFVADAKKALDAVEEEFNYQYKSINHNADFTARFHLMVLKTSLITMTNTYYRSYNAAPEAEKEAVHGEFVNELNQRQDAITRHLKHLTGKEGYMTISVLAELDRQSLVLAKLLSSTEYSDLFQAFQYANDRSYPKPELKDIMNKYIAEQYPQGELMAVVWFVFSQLSPADRIEVAKEINTSKVDLQKFLEAGNLHGAFSLDEMEKIRGGQKYDEKDRETYNAAYVKARDLKGSIKKMEESYGSYNAAGEMLTLGNIGGFVLDAGLIAMGAANFAVGVWKDPVGVFKNEYIQISAAGLTARHLMKKKEPIRVTISSKETRENRAREQAIQGLREEMRDTTSWEQWHEFFASGDYTGVKLFNEFRSYLLSIHDGQMPENINSEELVDFLKDRTGDDNIYAEEYQEGLSYAEKITHSDHLENMVKIFENFQKGGITNKDEYIKATEDAQTYYSN